MAVNYNYQDVSETIDLLKELRDDSIQQEQYLDNMLTTKTDSFLLDFVKDTYDFSGLNDTAMTITENLDTYIPWLEEANEKALNIEKGNIEKSGELRYEPTAGLALSATLTPCVYGPRPEDPEETIVQPLYGVEPAPNPTPCLYGPRPTDPGETIVQPLYGVEPSPYPSPEPSPYPPQLLYGPGPGPKPGETIVQPLYGVEPSPYPNPEPSPYPPQLLYGPGPGPKPGETIVQPLYGVEPAPTPNPEPSPYPPQLLYGPGPGPKPGDNIVQPLYGVEPAPTPTPTPTPCLYGPRPEDPPIPTPSPQPLYGVEPSPAPTPNPTVIPTGQTMEEPQPQPYIEQPQPQPQPVPTQVQPAQQYVEPATQTTQKTTSAVTLPKDVEIEKPKNTSLIDKEVANTTSNVTYYNDTSPRVVAKTPRTNTTNAQNTTQTSSTSGVSKGVVAASATAGVGALAAGGLLFATKMKDYKFGPEDWDELGPVIQDRVAKALYEAGFLDQEINKIINSHYKVGRAELNNHLEKIESAKTNYNKLGEEFGKVYNFSIINGGEVSKYLTFLTMIIDGKNNADEFNMYNIINPYLEDPDDVNKTYIGIKPNKYIDK